MDNTMGWYKISLEFANYYYGIRFLGEDNKKKLHQDTCDPPPNQRAEVEACVCSPPQELSK